MREGINYKEKEILNEKLIISDNLSGVGNIAYVKNAVGETVKRLGGTVSVRTASGRSEMEVSLPESSMPFVRPAVEDKIADVIAVGYKYGYFKRYVRTGGLGELEYELLLAALISADLDDDKRYIRARMKGSENYAVDGAFNFTMKPLKDKWAEVVGFIPSVFGKKELADFVSYLVGEKRGRRVYVESGRVYDKHFNRLLRSRLIPYGEAEVLREVIMSSAGEVELAGRIPETDEFYMKRFFGDGIFFGSGYFR